MKTFRRRHLVPIYNAKLQLIVCDNIDRELAKEPFELKDNGDPGVGACAYDYQHGNFAVCFNWKWIAPNVIGHEVFHVTHRIMDWHAAKFDIDNHETFAALNGYLTWWMIKQLKGKIKYVYT